MPRPCTAVLRVEDAYVVQDFLPVFAAGNEGFHGSNAEDGLKTVTSPATSKNCISAGATNTASQIDSQMASSQYIVYKMAISQQQIVGFQYVDEYKASSFLATPALIWYLHAKTETSELAKVLLQAMHALGQEFSIRYHVIMLKQGLMPSPMLCLQVMQASFGSSIKTLFGQQYTLSVASPADGCMAFNNSGNVAGTVVLVLRGSCYFAVKVGFSATCNPHTTRALWLGLLIPRQGEPSNPQHSRQRSATSDAGTERSGSRRRGFACV